MNFTRGLVGSVALCLAGSVFGGMSPPTHLAEVLDRRIILVETRLASGAPVYEAGVFEEERGSAFGSSFILDYFPIEIDGKLKKIKRIESADQKPIFWDSVKAAGESFEGKQVRIRLPNQQLSCPGLILFLYALQNEQKGIIVLSNGTGYPIVDLSTMTLTRSPKT